MSPAPSLSRPRAVAAVAVVALLALSLALVLVWQEAQQLEQTEALALAESEATQVASDIAVAMTSYDHRTVEEDFSWIDEDGTDSFQETFLESTRPIRGLIEKTRASAEGTVTDAAGTASDEDHVRVLLFVDQVISRQGTQRDSGESSRVVMEMVRQDDRWLVDDVELR